MIQSMTGYGAAQHVDDGVSYTIEVRTLNNRYLKLSIKLPEYLQFLESDVDKLLRRRISRGSVACTVRVRADVASNIRPINRAALQQYVMQLSAVSIPAGVQPTIDMASMLLLPGVCEPPDMDDAFRKRQVEIVTELATRSIDTMIQMRRDEGRALLADLSASCDEIRSRLSKIAARAPSVVDEYHKRLKTRVEGLLRAGGFELEQEGLMREVAIYAERCDISEEVARLGSHLDQFLQLCEREEQVGRTLDFLTQEILREANTIASKSNDAAIAREVVEIKGLVDRLREQVQNVE